MWLHTLSATQALSICLMTKHNQQFIETVMEYYRAHGRDYLPWRKTSNPYQIAVSEIMLQQTQVERVVPKYQDFVRQFPTTKQLAEASLAEVLTAWQGLGYNRRAKNLKHCAEVVHSEYRGRWPTTYEALQTVPGIGPYTAGAIMAFAYNQAVPLIETNIRTVYLHRFFLHQVDVTDKHILQSIAVHLKHLPACNVEAKTWYAALMDYGSYLKKVHGNPNRRSKSYTVQSTFAGSDRQVRGAIVRALATSPLSKQKLSAAVPAASSQQFAVQLEKLMSEGLVEKVGRLYQLPA